MKVYKIYNGEMVSVNTTATAKMVKFESREPAFGYLSREFKNNVAFTPQEAIQEKRNSLLSGIGMLEDKLKEKKAELDSLNKLESNYK